MAKDEYEDGLTAELVKFDKATAREIHRILDHAEREVHDLAMNAFQADPDMGMHYLAIYDAARSVTLSVTPHTHAPWQGGPSYGPHARDRHKRRTSR